MCSSRHTVTNMKSPASSHQHEVTSACIIEKANCPHTASTTCTPAYLAHHNIHVDHTQVAELATQFFISIDKPNVAGLVLAGSAEFKNELQTSDMFDSRLQSVVLAVVDVSYGACYV